MSRTAVIIVVGVVLMALFLGVGYLVKAIGVRRAMEGFLLVWFALAAGNLAIGIFEAGYGFAEELPIFLLIYAVPGLPAIAVRTWAGGTDRARNRPHSQQDNDRTGPSAHNTASTSSNNASPVSASTDRAPGGSGRVLRTHRQSRRRAP